MQPGIAPYEAEISDSGNIYQEMREIVGGPPQLSYPFKEPAALIYNKEWIAHNMPFNRAVNNIQGVVFGTFLYAGQMAALFVRYPRSRPPIIKECTTMRNFLSAPVGEVR